MRITVAVAAILVALPACSTGDDTMSITPRFSEGQAVSAQIFLSGNSLPFPVLAEVGPDGLRMGHRVSQSLPDLGLPLESPEVDRTRAFKPPEIDGQPELQRLTASEVVYLGRIPSTNVDVFIFSYTLSRWQGGKDLETIAVYVVDIDGHLLDLSYVAEEVAPGFNRSSLQLDNYSADVLWWGPLDPGVVAATVAVDGELRHMVRTSARFALFDMSGSERFADISLEGYDSGGRSTLTVQIPSSPPP